MIEWEWEWEWALAVATSMRQALRTSGFVVSVRTVSIPWTTLFSAVNTNNGLFVPVTGWMDAASVRSPKQGDGMSYPTAMTDVGSTTAGKQLVRLGFWFRTSEAVLKLARVGGKADIES